MGEGTGKSLSRGEFEAVIRRAAEIASSDSEPGEGDLSEAELFRIAGEVGLDERHVRRALSEVRSGVSGGGSLDRIFGPSRIRASRVVPGRPREIATRLDDFLVASQLLQPVRRTRNMLQYRPSVDWASQLARAASFTSRKYYVASAKSVEAHLDEVDEERTRVDLVVDPGTRDDSVVGAVLGGGAAGVAAGAGVGVLAVSTVPLALAIGAGVVVGSGVAGLVTSQTGASHKKKLLEVRAEVEGILDRLEFEESLEPPPASWRRWVKRQFHGVARDLMSVDDDPDGDLRDLDEELGEA